MTSTTISFAPAGVHRAGSAAVRAYACVGVLPTPVPAAIGASVPAAGVAPLPGSSAPFAGPARRPRWTTAPGAALTGTALTAVRDLQFRHESDPMTTNDGTTPLGIHPPGRPTS